MKLTDELKKEIGQGTDILTLTGPGYWVGNVIFMKRNVIASHIAGLQQHARDAGQTMALGIGTDQEGGLVSAFSTSGVATLFPGAMALASIPNVETGGTLKSSLDVAEAVYAAQGAELNHLGVNWVFAPVGDVNTFGDDPERVAQYVQSSCKGLTSVGIAPSVKHFPGHGDTRVDSHLGLPRVWKEWDSKPDATGLEDIELIPFRRLIENKSTCNNESDMITIMTGHMSLPLVTGKGDEPASLSAAVTNGILREKTKGLGFEGVIVTDCLEMNAISKTKEDLEKEKKGEPTSEGIGANPGTNVKDEADRGGEWAGGPGIEEGAILALEAGADVVMICHTFEKQKGAVERVWEAVESGRISLDKLRESSTRITRWKKALHLEWDLYDQRGPWNQATWAQLKRQHAELSTTAYSRIVACLKEGEMLNTNSKVVIFTPAMESYNLAVDDAEGVLRTKEGAVRNTAGASFISFTEAIRMRIPEAHHVVFGQGDIDSLHVAADEQVVFTLRNADRGRWQLQALERVLALVKRQIVVVSSSTPYDLVGFESVHRTPYVHLACNEYTKPALEAVAKVIFGEQKPVGKLPVVV
ncbi:glycoside hydrolase [Gymnopus androsaceus JB14]|uniref:Glycoside hydrolase n=1 Tax=Gymnopus androsaceus JB14 TaxID=1447944 RepID=A0A6A4I632_9AGAR|nr:glycoside hydrolase [Gymnopus androsaceus JB14]